MNKKDLRNEFRRKIKAVPSDQRSEESQMIARKLGEVLQDQEGYWTLYHPLSDEPNLMDLTQQDSNIKWLFPNVEEEGPLTFAPENSTESVSLEKISGFVIPALAYDNRGVRLGRGGGYYDRTLAASKGLRIGVVFATSLSPEPLPKEDHDQLMDMVVSSQQTLDMRKVSNGYS